ncbi:MAG: transcriptional repressor [Spirochaetaceae bacterium]|jgi:Fur family peroxide stress response transcriptional regulator|nr:transcriptional repressor [Spirochaetaceae bacterium]
MISIGRKRSKKRDEILRVIRSTASHPSAHWVYECLKASIPRLSLATVYRNITLFMAEGTVASVCVVDGKERFDGVVMPHPHFVCTSCGGVFDFPYPPPVYTDMEGFKIDCRKTVFYGICPHCAAI